MFGDSITQMGWQAGGICQRLADNYARRLDVINRGLSGYNTDWAIPVLEQCLVPHSDASKFPKTRLLTIWFGANDACLPFHFQHVPLEKYADNLRQFIHMVSHPDSAWYSPETKIVLITPPPINSHQWRANLEARDPPQQVDRQFDVTAAYAQAVRDVGKEKNVLVVDAFQALWDVAGHEERGLSKYLSDGLHLTVDGYEVVYDQLIKLIREKLPALYHEELPGVFVPYDQVDTAHLRSSLAKREIFA